MFEQEQLLMALGETKTNKITQCLRRFAFMPDSIIERLAETALHEEWGKNLFALEKYLSVHLIWSLEQSRFTHSHNQLYIAAGHLQTRYGTPLYLVFEKNSIAGKQPWILVKAGSSISAADLPLPPTIPSATPIPPSAEIVMSHDHILGENARRVTFLEKTPPVAQICAVAGAIQWSLKRGLQIPHTYYGKTNYVVPLYLTSRENITLAPDLVAPIEVHQETLMVRTVLEPHMPYANARVAVKRHDQLPPWLLDCWNRESQKMDLATIEDPEESAIVAI